MVLLHQHREVQKLQRQIQSLHWALLTQAHLAQWQLAQPRPVQTHPPQVLLALAPPVQMQEG